MAFGSRGDTLEVSDFVPPWMWVCVVLIAICVRTVGLDGIPLTNDEQHYVATSLAPEEFANISAIRDVLTAGWIEGRARHPLLFQLANHFLIFPVFGTGFGAMRLLNALAGILTVIFTGMLARTLGASSRQSLAAAAVLAIMPFHVRFSRSAYLDPFFVMWIAGAFLSAAVAIRRQSVLLGILTGILAAAMASTKISAPLFVTGVVAFALIPVRGGPLLSRKAGASLVAAFLAFLALFLLLNDPWEYASAVLSRESSDSKYGQPVSVWLDSTLLDGEFWVNLGGVAGLLLPATIFPALIGAIRFGQWERRDVGWMLALGLPCLPLVVLHAPAFSGEHGLLPFAIIASILAGFGCVDFSGNVTKSGLLYFATAPVLAFLWGLNFGPLPYSPYYNPVRGFDPGYEAIRLLGKHASPDSITVVDYVTEDSLRHFILGAPGPVIGFDLHRNPDAFRSDLIGWCDQALVVGDAGAVHGARNLEPTAARVVGPNVVQLFVNEGARVPIGPPDLDVERMLEGGTILTGPRWCLFLSSFEQPVIDGQKIPVTLRKEEQRERLAWRAPTPHLEIHFSENFNESGFSMTLELDKPHPWFVFGRSAYVRLRNEYAPARAAR